MIQFSVSSFIDLVNAIICAVIAYRLYHSYLSNNIDLIKHFSAFYSIFSAFFLFLGIPFFIPSYPSIIQLLFVIAHLLLYFAIAILLYIFFRLLKFTYYALISSIVLSITGIAIFFISILEGNAATIHYGATILMFELISWSHGGSYWILSVIGGGGVIIAFSVGLFFLLKSSYFLHEPILYKKSRLLGVGFLFLGMATIFAFIFKIFNFYNFSIVFLAEVIAISGLIISLTK